MSDNPKHAKPWTDHLEHRDWIQQWRPATGRHRKQATK